MNNIYPRLLVDLKIIYKQVLLVQQLYICTCICKLFKKTAQSTLETTACQGMHNFDLNVYLADRNHLGHRIKYIQAILEFRKGRK